MESDFQKNYLVAVLGPTAVGKTAISIQLAQILDAEIISSDSRQFYKNIPIGTAQPDTNELQSAKHHFIAFLNLDQDYSAGKFEKDAIQKIKNLHSKSKAVILTGGSGLYVKAVLSGLDDLPPKNETLRNDLIKSFEEHGIKFLQEKLNNLDPEYFQKVDQQNPHRLIRGIEVFLSSGKSIISFQQQNIKKRPFKVIKVILNRDREELYERINLRVDQMFEAGLLEEVKRVTEFKSNNALQTVGYAELFNYFEGNIDLPEAKRLIKRNSRRYAKRQLTWLRKETDTQWFHPKDINKIKEFILSEIEYGV